MSRKKVKLAFIVDASVRKATYKKRKKGLLKKLNELSILCDVETCAVISSHFDSKPEAWPSPMKAQDIITKFKDMPEIDQSMRMVNQESFIRSRIDKTLSQLKTKQAENNDKIMKQILFDIMNGSGVPPNVTMPDLRSLRSFVEKYMQEVCLKMESLCKEEEKKNVVAVQANMGGEHAIAMQDAVGTILPVENVAEYVKKDSEGFQNQKRIEQMMSPPPPVNHDSVGPSGNFGFDGDNDLMLATLDAQNAFWSDPFWP